MGNQVIVIVGVLLFIFLKIDSDKDALYDNKSEPPFYLTLSPFGRQGFICQHVWPATYTSVLKNFFWWLGRCSQSPQKVVVQEESLSVDREESQSADRIRSKIDSRQMDHFQDRLIAAVSRGDERAVRYLFKQGADVNAVLPASDEVPEGTTPLMVASAKGHEQIVWKLLNRGGRKR